MHTGTERRSAGRLRQQHRYCCRSREHCILISHRLANVVQADHIYVMKHGSITEQGTHERLMEQQGTYYELYHSQKQLEQYGKEAAV